MSINSDHVLHGVDIRQIKSPGYGIRHLQVLLLFLLLNVGYFQRVNMSVAIVAITDTKNPNPNAESYDWSLTIQSLVLSSFFWGYSANLLPAGPISRHYGSKKVLLISTFVCSILNLLTPWIASLGGWKAIVSIRIMQGLMQSYIFPCCHTLLSRWVPRSERGRLATFCYAGAQSGTVIMLAISGVLASSFMGWSGIFYVSGASGLAWTIGWVIFGSNSPSESKYITIEEKLYIENMLGSDVSYSKSKSIPWKGIISSVPFLALICVHVGQSWGFVTLLTNIPTFLAKALGIDVKSNALLSSLPYLTMFLLSFIFSWISDYINNRRLISATTSRKIFNSIGHWIPMIILVLIGYLGNENETLIIVLLILAVGFNAGVFVGFLPNHIDLSPNYAGILMSITNFFSNGIGLLAPLTVGFLVDGDGENIQQWRIVFFISAIIYFVGNLTFVVFGKAEVQLWNNPGSRRSSTL